MKLIKSINLILFVLIMLLVLVSIKVDATHSMNISSVSSSGKENILKPNSSEGSIGSASNGRQDSVLKSSSVPQKIQALQDDTSIANVETWKQLVDAYKNEDIKQINFMADLDGSGEPQSGQITNVPRKTSITINGNNHTLKLTNTNVYGGFFIDRNISTPMTFTLENFSKISSNMLTTYGIVSTNVDPIVTYYSKWTVNVSNVTSDENMRTRLVNNNGGQLNFSGRIIWYTKSEMVATGGVDIAPNSYIVGRKVQKTAGGIENRSFFWYRTPITTGQVGSGDFNIGDNSTVLFNMEGNGTAYPMVYAYYKKFNVGKNVTLNATMPGNAWRSDYMSSDFYADGEDKINFTSLRSGYAPIVFGSSADPNSPRSFWVGKDSDFYIIGNTNQPLFRVSNAADGARRSITIDSPANFDLRNSSSGTGANSSVASPNLKSFRVLNSDISLWKLASSPIGPSDFYAPGVRSVEQLANGTILTENSTLKEAFSTTKNRRISGFNQNPAILPEIVTNSTYSYKVRVKIADIPDNNGMDDDGNIEKIPQYASKDEATVHFTDTMGKQVDVKTDKDGYASVTEDYFQLAGKYITAYATSTGKESDPVKIAVKDVTPPEPTDIDQDNGTGGIYSDIKKLSVSGDNKNKHHDEVGAIVTYTINNKEALGVDGKALQTIVDKDGYWSLPVNQSLKIGDSIQIFLTDQFGNKEPATETMINDFKAKAATKYIVQAIPLKDEMIYQAKNLTYKTDFADKTVGHADDTLQYRLTYKVNDDSPESLTGGVVKSQLPTNITLINNTTKVTYSNGKEEDLKDLDNLKLDDIKKDETVTIVFNVKVSKDVKVGEQLDSIMTLNGETSGGTAVERVKSTLVTVEAPSKQSVTFNYVNIDSAGQQTTIAPPVTVLGNIGQPVSNYTKANDPVDNPNGIASDVAPKYISGYTVWKMKIDNGTEEQAERADPIISTTPQTYTYYYKTAGIMLEVPEDFDFGDYYTTKTNATYFLSTTDKTAEGKGKPYTVNIKDTYGVDNWELSVQQEKQFTGKIPVKNSEPRRYKDVSLDNAQLKFSNITFEENMDKNSNRAGKTELKQDQFTLDVGGNPLGLASYTKDGHYLKANNNDSNGTKYDDPGDREFNYQFGNSKNADRSIGLYIPENTTRYETKYTTEITWILAVAP